MEPKRLSASSMKTYLQCLLKYYYRYYDKKPRPGRTDPLAFGTAVHKGLEVMYQLVAETGKPPGPDEYVKVYKAFMDSATSEGLKDLSLYEEGREMLTRRLDNVSPDENVIGMEFGFELETENGTPFIGYIDKLLELDPETAVVIDYKTSRTALTQEEADTDIQMSMYDVAVRMLYPQYKTVVLAFDYLRLNEVISYRTATQRTIFIELMDSIYQGISRLSKEDMVPSLNNFCGWCDYREYCPAYRDAVTDPDLLLPRLENLTDDEFIEAWELFQNTKRAVNKHDSHMKDHAYQRAKGGPGKIEGRKLELVRVQTPRVSYDKKTVFDLAGPDGFYKLATVNKSAVDKFITDHPEHGAILRDSASYAYNAPFFRAKKK